MTTKTKTLGTVNGFQIQTVEPAAGFHYNQEQLEAAFELVRNKADWKAPVKAFCRDEQRQIIAEAVVWFTATEAAFEDAAPGWLKVTAPGYRRGPAGDH